MILHHAVWKDLVFHYLIVLLLMAYFKRAFGFTHGSFIVSTVLATLILTYLNHRFFPQLAIQRYLNKPQEAFQACNLRWGNKPCDCQSLLTKFRAKPQSGFALTLSTRTG